MHYLNRVSLIGHLTENPKVYCKTNNESVATLSLQTTVEGESHHHKHNIFIEGALMVQYADIFLTAGDLVFVEGQLEPMAGEPEPSRENWIVVSDNQGLLHPVYSKAKVLQKSSHYSA